MPIFDVLLNISPSNDHRRLYHSSFESSHQDESNGGNFILLQSLDGQIFDETSKIGIYKYKKCVLLNISPSNYCRRLYHGIAHSNRLIKPQMVQFRKY